MHCIILRMDAAEADTSYRSPHKVCDKYICRLIDTSAGHEGRGSIPGGLLQQLKKYVQCLLLQSRKARDVSLADLTRSGNAE